MDEMRILYEVESDEKDEILFNSSFPNHYERGDYYEFCSDIHSEVCLSVE